MVPENRHLGRLANILKLRDILVTHADRVYKGATRKGNMKHTVELPLELLEPANDILKAELGSEHDVLTLARMKMEADPDVRKKYPGGIPDEDLGFELDEDRGKVRISGKAIPLYAFLYHLLDTLEPLASYAERSAAGEYLENTADILRDRGFEVDLHELRQRVKTLEDAHTLYYALATAPEWFWDYVKIHNLSAHDVIEHMLLGPQYREFWDLLDKHPELRRVLHPDFAPYLSGSGKSARLARARLVSNKNILSQVDPIVVSRAIRARGAKNVIRLFRNPEISLSDLVKVLSEPHPPEELDFLLSRLEKYRSLDNYVKKRLSDGQSPILAQQEKLKRLFSDLPIFGITHLLPMHLRHLSEDLVFRKVIAKEYQKNEDFALALKNLNDAFLTEPVRALLARYANTGNPAYLREAVARISEYGKMLKHAVRGSDKTGVTRDDIDRRKWERLILKNPVYRPLRYRLLEEGIDPQTVIGKIIEAARSVSGDDIGWARHPKNAQRVMESVLRVLKINPQGASKGSSKVVVKNLPYFAGSAAEAISRLLATLGGETNIWKHPKGYVVIPIRGLKDHDLKFAAELPRYLQKAVGRPVPIELMEHEMRIPLDRLPELIARLKELEGNLRGESRRKVRRFRKILEGFVES